MHAYKLYPLNKNIIMVEYVNHKQFKNYPLICIVLNKYVCKLLYIRRSNCVINI